MGSHSTKVPNSSRKLHSIHILVLVHNAMYMAHATLPLDFNFPRFPPRCTKIEVWPICKLKISTADINNTIIDDIISDNQNVGTVLSAVLKCQIKTHRNK